MKKIILNINDSLWEKFRFEAIIQKKSVQKIIEERVLHKPFHDDVEKAYNNFMNEEIERLLKE